MELSGERELQPEESGELWVRAPTIVKGYWQDEVATRNAISYDGWLKTGDIAYIDRFRSVRIIARKKVGTAVLAFGSIKLISMWTPGPAKSWGSPSSPLGLGEGAMETCRD